MIGLDLIITEAEWGLLMLFFQLLHSLKFAINRKKTQKTETKQNKPAKKNLKKDPQFF